MMDAKKDDNLVRIPEYCRIHECSESYAKVRCRAGDLKTARKIGKIWYLDKTEKPPADKRVKSGYFKDWRKK